MRRTLSLKKFERYFSALLISAALIPVALVTSYAGEPGRYIGLVLFAFVGYIGLFEFYRVMGLSKWLSGLMPLVIVPFLLINFDDFQALIAEPAIATPIRVRWAIGDWAIYVFVLAGALTPVVVSSRFRAAPNLLFNILLIYVFTLIALVLVKVVWTWSISNFWLFAFFVLIAVLADSSAYLSGRWLGHRQWKHRFKNPQLKKLQLKSEWFLDQSLAPRLSPRKTLVGFIVSLILTSFFAIIAGYYTNIWSGVGPNRLAASIPLGFLLAVIAPIGDLTFSAVKRYRNAKDFSRLIPGHGGIFDRFDALSFVVFAAAIVYSVS